MPADQSAATEPHDSADLLAAVRQVVAELVQKPQPLLLKKPWAYVGVGKTTWYQLASAGKTPRPVKLEGVGAAYRRSDLDEFVRKLKTA